MSNPPRASDDQTVWCGHASLQHGKNHWGWDEPFTSCDGCGKQWDGHLTTEQAVKLSPRERLRAKSLPVTSDKELLSNARARIAELERERDDLTVAIQVMCRKLEEGTLHVGYCNGNHAARVGDPEFICNCTLGREIKSLRFDRDRLAAELDNKEKP